MHSNPCPSLPAPRVQRRSGVAVSGALVLVVLATLSAGSAQKGPDKRSGQQPPPAPVTVAQVTTKTVRDVQEFVGTVRALRRVRIGSGVAARVIAKLVRYGDRVEKDQELVRLRGVPTRLQLEGAKQELALRAAEALEAHNGPRPQEIAVAKARLAAAEATVAYQDWSLQQTKELRRQKTTSEDTLRQVLRARDSARAARDEAKAQLELLQAGTRPEEIARADALVEQQKEAVKLLEDHLDKHVIRAPFAAYVSAELTEVGAWLDTGTDVVELLDLDHVEVEAPVPEGLTGQLELGDKVTARLPSLHEHPFEGTVVAIVPDADTRSRTLPVRVRVKNELVAGQPLLKAGMLASVRLAVGEAHAALLVPKDALVLGGPSPVVYVLAGPPKAGVTTVRLVPVTLGFGVGDRQVVSAKGLAAGDSVVVRGNERLRPGQPVRVETEPATGDGREGK